ncbi:DUF3380 domain-containing protein [Paraburkholderia sp. LEh10]|uniref:N-acetylmuramidase domain-containing protein n=1 Tax=Paraburkholderia sp. LEh10 TaxID=2821353 RepID=UPI001AE9918E|nr:N-acetylmuramidase domain-containing protein [Paraburkholderia sp. LEh10]MBP0590016.1 DUF3380 domain-containing protein [Paraburkholderia sp. LEh10]
MKDTPTRKKEVTEDEQTHKMKTSITIEHHYKVVDTGKPTTIAFNVLGSRLNYPNPAIFSEQQYKNMATQLNVEVAAIKAIVQQESQGHPFLENGLPPILYERRHFFDLAVKKRAREQQIVNSAAKRRGGQVKESSPQTHILNSRICAFLMRKIITAEVGCINMKSWFARQALILRWL